MYKTQAIAAVNKNDFAIKQTNNLPLTSRSPLRYPGGKTRAIAYITQYFPDNLKQMVSPFLGGGSIELFMAAQGVKVYGYDAFAPLSEFWQCLTSQPQALADEVEKHYPLPKEQFYELQKTQTHFETPLQRAAVFYVLNRSSFSGATLSGGMSPDHPRFTISSVERLREFCNPNITIEQADFTVSLTKHGNAFTYLDPPYLIKSNLYGKKGSTHRDFAHATLAALLHKKENWLLSYNDCEEIREWYKDFRIVTPTWKYGMSADKASKEVLILGRG